MSWSAHPEQQDVVRLLQRSLDQGRLAHGLIFQGPDLAELEGVARTLAKVLCCERPPRRGASGRPLDSCDACAACRKADEGLHPDVTFVRPESKTRVIKIEQIRQLLDRLYLKPTQAPVKVAILVAADRLNPNAANAFLKTLEEPPPDTFLLLLSTEPQRMLETILSRCQRLAFAGEGQRHRHPALLAWVREFSGMAAAGQKSLLGRYRLLSALLQRLAAAREAVEAELKVQSPLERHDDIESELRDKWEEELKAAVESEYRRHRGELVGALQWWLRDVLLTVQNLGQDLLSYPECREATLAVAGRISSADAMENLRQLEQLQRLLFSNVQEALALEVGLLRLRL
ncbi:MAG: polymerase subunit delta [Verrucomicrobiota bacterium]|jgi:DNA polymerase-3 subunit delta'